MVVIIKEVWVFYDNIAWVFNGKGAQIDDRLFVELVGVLEKSWLFFTSEVTDRTLEVKKLGQGPNCPWAGRTRRQLPLEFLFLLRIYTPAGAVILNFPLLCFPAILEEYSDPFSCHLWLTIRKLLNAEVNDVLDLVSGLHWYWYLDIQHLFASFSDKELQIIQFSISVYSRRSIQSTFISS